MTWQWVPTAWAEFEEPAREFPKTDWTVGLITVQLVPSHVSLLLPLPGYVPPAAIIPASKDPPEPKNLLLLSLWSGPFDQLVPFHISVLFG